MKEKKEKERGGLLLFLLIISLAILVAILSQLPFKVTLWTIGLGICLLILIGLLVLLNLLWIKIVTTKWFESFKSFLSPAGKIIGLTFAAFVLGLVPGFIIGIFKASNMNNYNPALYAKLFSPDPMFYFGYVFKQMLNTAFVAAFITFTGSILYFLLKSRKEN